jgi:flavoprotein
MIVIEPATKNARETVIVIDADSATTTASAAAEKRSANDYIGPVAIHMEVAMSWTMVEIRVAQ